jgi:hypothetical protein
MNQSEETVSAGTQQAARAGCIDIRHPFAVVEAVADSLVGVGSRA